MMNQTRFRYLLVLFLAPLAIMYASAAAGGDTGVVEANPTTQDIIELILYILLALLFSFLCSIAESVLLNITPSFIADKREKSPGFADKVQKYRIDNVDQSLAAILTMNTIAHTVGAIGSGAKATIVFGSVYFGLFSTIMTLLILFLSEIIPKTIGVVYWRKLSGSVILYIQILNFILYPIIWISETLTKLITRGESVHVFNKDEFIAMASVGAKAGAFDKHESQILLNLFKMGSVTAEDIYTPRTVIEGIDQNLTVSEVFSQIVDAPFSRIVVYDDNLDNVTGFILKEDLLKYQALGKGETQIKEIQYEIPAVSSDMSLTQLFELFQTQRQRIVLVVDDYGTKGLVSSEDVLETLLGIEIIDENDQIDDMRMLARHLWEKRMDRLGVSKDKTEL